MILREKPAGFNKRFDIAGCFIEHDGKFLLLHRHPHKASGDTWGLPAGKKEPGEETKEATLREVEEETGLKLAESSVQHFDSFYVRNGDFDIEWHMFYSRMDTAPVITINPNEHSEFRWVTPGEALQMDLIHDLPESIELFYGRPGILGQL